MSILLNKREHCAFTAAYGLIGKDWVENPYIEIDAYGTIIRTQSSVPPQTPGIIYDFGRMAILPGLINAHSHAFQQRLRGITQRIANNHPSNFWSWRDSMYQLASGLTPESLFTIAKDCYNEMLDAGITCVGEFHYVHHQQDGSLYADPNELSLQIIRAAAETGIRLVLLEVYYARAGYQQPLDPVQRRFCDASVDSYLQRVAALQKLTNSTNFAIGLAPHSVRAVAQSELQELATYAKNYNLKIHAHVSEQPKENSECHAEYGYSPMNVFARSGCLDQAGMFTAIHGIHVTEEDVKLLKNQTICACPTTEADLGDGIVPGRIYQQAGVNLALGSDSNSIIDLLQEARLLEMNERLHNQTRICLADSEKPLGQTLLEIATIGGARSLGQNQLGQLIPGSPFDAFTIDLSRPPLMHVPAPCILDALVSSGTSAVVSHVFVGGQRLR